MDPDPDLGKEIELDPERGIKGIHIRPNEVDPGGSGYETLISNVQYISNLYMKKRWTIMPIAYERQIT